MIRKREIIGTGVSITDYDEVVAQVDEAAAQQQQIYVCCAPASTLVFARDDRRLASALAGAQIVTPDGMGVVHAARMLGEPIRERVYGPDLMELVLGRSSSSHYLYGGHDDATLRELESAITRRFPDAAVVGSFSPPHRELTEQELASIAESINASGAGIVWVGIGSPKQELFMQQLRERVDAPVLIGVGAAFDFLAGRTAQAPRWMQRASLEWLYRISQDPLRLGRRYLLTLPRFVVLVLAQAVRERRIR